MVVVERLSLGPDTIYFRILTDLTSCTRTADTAHSYNDLNILRHPAGGMVTVF
jgi:hypothetical protein